MRIASLAIVSALALASAPAHAERRTCEVVFVRAPDEVRLVIEGWLKAEPRCSGTIELRVVETETGSLYLIAQRPDGRIHEREVPDAQSAGVLVASWVADDWTRPPSEVTPEPPPTPAPLSVNPFTGAPGVTDAIAVTAPPPPPPPERAAGRWIALSPMIAMAGEGGGGLRADLDVLGGHRWTFGLMGSMTEQQIDYAYGEGWGRVQAARVGITAARTFLLGGKWSIRAATGLAYNKASVTVQVVDYQYGWMTHQADFETASLELGVAIARAFGRSERFALSAGPMMTMMAETQVTSYEGATIEFGGGELMFVASARYRL